MINARLLMLFACVHFTIFLSFGKQSYSDTSATSQFFNLQKDGKFDKALEYTSDEFRVKVSSARLAQIWKQTEQMYGAFSNILKMTMSKTDSLNIISALAIHKKARLTWRVVFGPDQKIHGFFLVKGETIDEDGDENRFLQKEITVDVLGGHIKGTLQYPETKSDTNIVAIIIAGSGPTDRNGNNPLGVSANTYQMLADSLASHGIASFRYDKRGIAASNNFADLTETTFEDFVRDASTCVGYLKEMEKFPTCIVIGHSEGALIGLLTAKQADVSALISIAGMGLPFGEVIKDQYRTILNPKASEQELALLENQLDSLKNGIPVQAPLPNMEPFFSRTMHKFISTLMQYHPMKEIAGLNIPILLVHGTKDLQLPVRHAKKLAKANPAVALSVIEGVNHILKDAQTSVSDNLATYSNPSIPLNVDLVKTVVEFIDNL